MVTSSPCAAAELVQIVPPNERMELTAPLGAAPGDEDAVRGASCAFAHRRRSSSAVSGRYHLISVRNPFSLAGMRRNGTVAAGGPAV
jgi:hypothetical protein